MFSSTKVVTNAKTFSDIIKYFGYRNKAGGTWRALKARLAVDNIDCSHIIRHTAESRIYNGIQMAIPIKLVLVEDSKYSNKRAIRHILHDNLIPYICAICGMGPEWNGKKLTLRLDHINGINNDHRITNLRFLCPNCDSQTSTYGGRNCKKRHNCIKCGKPVTSASSSGLCRECVDPTRNHGISRCPPKDELEQLIWKLPTTKIAAKYGVSDKAVTKWCRKYDMVKPGPGYWRKLEVK